MKNKAILVSMITLFVLAFAITAVAASDFVNFDDVEVNGIEIINDNVSESVGVTVSEKIPVAVRFTALEDTDDVRVKVYVEGYKSEISDETSRFHILEGKTYVKRFTLELPSSLDLDNLFEDLQLLIRISAKGQESKEVYVPLTVQKDLYSLNLLSIDVPDVVYTGDRVAVNVVVENNGNDRLDNVYVRATIPGLGISQKVYAGDLAPNVDEYDDDINDARPKTVYLTIPRNAVPGNYEIEIEAYNYDSSVKSTGRIVVRDVEAGVIPSSTLKTIAPGDETSFNLVLVNPSDRMVVYTITPEESKGVLVEVTEPVVTVGSDSSRTVQVLARATKSTKEGTYVITLNANSEAGVSKQVSFSVNVEKPSEGITGLNVSGSSGPTNTAVVLTVILVIVFVVLLIILIVLLTKKPAEQEELGETNYY